MAQSIYRPKTVLPRFLRSAEESFLILAVIMTICVLLPQQIFGPIGYWSSMSACSLAWCVIVPLRVVLMKRGELPESRMSDRQSACILGWLAYSITVVSTFLFEWEYREAAILASSVMLSGVLLPYYIFWMIRRYLGNLRSRSQRLPVLPDQRLGSGSSNDC